MSLFPYHHPFAPACPSSSFLGPPSLFPPLSTTNPGVDQLGPGGNSGQPDAPGSTITYHGVCLTVWSHADAERSAAIGRTLEAGRSRKSPLRASLPRASRASAQTPKIRLSKHVTNISAMGVDGQRRCHGWRNGHVW